MLGLSLFYVLFLLEQTVWIAVVIGIVRFKDLAPKYLPIFLYLLSRAMLELWANLIAIYAIDQNNSVPYNILNLTEALLITWQLYKFGSFKNRRNIYLFLQFFWILLWFTDILIIGSLKQTSTFFHTTHSFILIFLAANLISNILISSKQSLIKNTAFLVCITFSIWFAYNVLYALARYVMPQVMDKSAISPKIITFMECSEMILYLTLAWAIYCIPKKRKLNII